MGSPIEILYKLTNSSLMYLEIERGRSSSLSERQEEEDQEEAEADGGGDGGVLENIGVTTCRGCSHIVTRAGQVFVTAENENVEMLHVVVYYNS